MQTRWSSKITTLLGFTFLWGAAGCGGAEAPTATQDSLTPSMCTDREVEPGWQTMTLWSKSRLRGALYYVPDSYDGTQPHMLVLNLHAFGVDGWAQDVLSQMRRQADQHGFIVVYPEGIANSWNGGDCCGTAWTDTVDDVQFTRDLLDELEETLCVDPARIYAAGMSNGGFMTHRLGCELSDRLAAIAPVAGVLGVDPQECQPTRPIPVLDFHGTWDIVVPYDGGTPLAPDLGVGLVFRSVDATMAHWAEQNGCTGEPTVFYDRRDVTCVAWGQCAEGAETQLCTIRRGGHTWPGAPLLGTTQTIDATETIVEFFQNHPLPTDG